MNIKPENTFEMELALTTVKAALSNNEVPSNKNSRKVYGMILSNRYSELQQITLTIEAGTDVIRTIPPIVLNAWTTLDISRPLDSPIFTMLPGQNIKGVASTGSASVILSCYDLE